MRRQVSHFHTRDAKHVFPLHTKQEAEGVTHIKRPLQDLDLTHLYSKSRRFFPACSPIHPVNGRSDSTGICCPWTSLPKDLLHSVLHHITSARDLIAFSGTCSNWRKAALEEKSYLSAFRFSIDHKRPFINGHKKFQAIHCEQLPASFSKVGEL